MGDCQLRRKEDENSSRSLEMWSQMLDATALAGIDSILWPTVGPIMTKPD
jgi:hypothetical protein